MIKFNDSSFFKKKTSISGLIGHEMLQFKKNQSVKLKDYMKARLDFLKAQPGAELSIDNMKQFSPKIGLFAGSFNPFHKGHFNVLQKAEKIFDKVIIAFGKNPEKQEKN